MCSKDRKGKLIECKNVKIMVDYSPRRGNMRESQQKNSPDPNLNSAPPPLIFHDWIYSAQINLHMAQSW